MQRGEDVSMGVNDIFSHAQKMECVKNTFHFFGVIIVVGAFVGCCVVFLLVQLIWMPSTAHTMFAVFF